jgi:hypothetical protein
MKAITSHGYWHIRVAGSGVWFQVDREKGVVRDVSNLTGGDAIRWVADRVEVRFAAVVLPTSKPSGLQFGLAARRRLVGKR